MTTLLLISIDLAAIAVLTAVYFHRHRRRDLVVAFVGVNVGVLAVASVLSTSTVGLGLGLGLFGVLSIIRLRSTEISQREVSYYFAALALGLIGGLSTTISPTPVALMVLIVGAMVVVDHPRLLRRSRQQTLVLDATYAEEADLITRTEQVLGGRVRSLTVLHTDLVNDTTTVDVRFDAPRGSRLRDPERGLPADDRLPMREAHSTVGVRR